MIFIIIKQCCSSTFSCCSYHSVGYVGEMNILSCAESFAESCHVHLFYVWKKMLIIFLFLCFSVSIFIFLTVSLLSPSLSLSTVSVFSVYLFILSSLSVLIYFILVLLHIASDPLADILLFLSASLSLSLSFWFWDLDLMPNRTLTSCRLLQITD